MILVKTLGLFREMPDVKWAADRGPSVITEHLIPPLVTPISLGFFRLARTQRNNKRHSNDTQIHPEWSPRKGNLIDT
jgi:hypothetical protein